MVRIRRALISLTDKRGLEELSRGLAKHGVELLSTGGTARRLRDSGAQVTDVASWTGSGQSAGSSVCVAPRNAINALAVFLRGNLITHRATNPGTRRVSPREAVPRGGCLVHAEIYRPKS